MSSFNFLFNGREIIIPCEKKEKLVNVVQRFISKVGSKRSNLNFLCNGKILDEQITEEKIPFNESKKRFIQVDDNSKINNPEDVIINSNIIICPQCKECASINLNENKISISNCKNMHNNDLININDFPNTQKLNLTKIICGQCKENNMGTAYENTFFRCVECKINLCSLCKAVHNQKHNVYIYSNKYYICEEHGELYTSYCFKCKKDLCFLCEENHLNHKIISFNKMDNYDDKDKINKLLIKLKEHIDNMKEKINNITNICNKIISAYEILYNIKKGIYENINRKFRNIQKIKNQKFINNENNFDLEMLINEDNFDKKYLKIVKEIFNLNISKKSDTYENFENEENSNKENDDNILIKYKINDRRVKIFGNEFVNNNDKICKILYDTNIYCLSEYFDIENLKTNIGNILEIKLTGINKITNAHSMFHKCTSLISLPDISKLKTDNITNMSAMFMGCSALTLLSDISKWNTKNVANISFMFDGCSSLEYLPDISQWDISNVTNMQDIFRDCSSLKSLPDISKWNTNKVTFMQDLFCRCSSLISLPDISKWNTSNVTFMSFMFNGCSSLKSLPNINKWNIDKVTNKDYMFEGCPSSLIIPKKFK